MPDENDQNKPRIVPPPVAPTSSSAAPARQSLLVEQFEVLANPTGDELIRLAARMANFLNLLVAESLRSRVVTAAQPIPMAFLNASASMEQGALQQRQYLAQMAAMQGGGFASPGQGGGPGMPPFRMPN